MDIGGTSRFRGVLDNAGRIGVTGRIEFQTNAFCSGTGHIEGSGDLNGHIEGGLLAEEPSTRLDLDTVNIPAGSQFAVEGGAELEVYKDSVLDGTVQLTGATLTTVQYIGNVANSIRSLTGTGAVYANNGSAVRLFNGDDYTPSNDSDRVNRGGFGGRLGVEVFIDATSSLTCSNLPSSGPVNRLDSEITGKLTNAGEVKTASTLHFLGGVENTGTMDIGGTSRFSGVVTNSGTILAKGSVIMDCSSFVNSGFLIDESSGTILLKGDVVNSGEIIIDSSFDFEQIRLAGGSISGSTLIIQSSDTLSGNGTVDTDVVNQGFLELKTSVGAIEIHGNYSQASSGVLSIELSEGKVADQLIITGSASLDGSINVSLLGGYLPHAGDRFEILEAASLIGGFSAENLPVLGTNDTWLVNLYPTSVELRVANASDTDGDGLPDAWELDKFSSLTRSDGDADDSDNDGLSDLAEWIAGSDPDDPKSQFKINKLDVDNSASSDFVINWISLSNRVYGVYRSDSLDTGFSPLSTNIHYPQNSYTDTTHNAESEGFYKVEVRLK
jgi:hypothetical protein